jgi:hypothetical protein
VLSWRALTGCILYHISLALINYFAKVLLKDNVHCSHVRTVVATLGGKQGAAGRFDKWQYLHSGFTVWLSVSDATGKEALFCSSHTLI